MRRRRLSTTLSRTSIPAVLVVITLFAGCGDSGDSAAESADGELTFAPELNVDLTAMERNSTTGLYTRDLEVGTGEEAQPGQRATVHYTGWLPNGQQFDSSRGGDPFSFDLGAGGVIQGWDEGVVGMRVGGRRQLVIPPELGYGAAGAGGVIPPNATLVFDVELLQLN